MKNKSYGYYKDLVYLAMIGYEAVVVPCEVTWMGTIEGNGGRASSGSSEIPASVALKLENLFVEGQKARTMADTDIFCA